MFFVHTNVLKEYFYITHDNDIPHLIWESVLRCPSSWSWPYASLQMLGPSWLLPSLRSSVIVANSPVRLCPIWICPNKSSWVLLDIFSEWRSFGIVLKGGCSCLKPTMSVEFWSDSTCSRLDLLQPHYLQPLAISKRVPDIQFRMGSHEVGTICTGYWLLNVRYGHNTTRHSACGRSHKQIHAQSWLTTLEVSKAYLHIYLVGTKDFGIHFRPNEPLGLVSYTDSNFVNCLDS